MSLVSFLFSPIATYLELTVTEPCRNIKQVRREKKVMAAHNRRFSLLAALRNQRRAASPEDESAPLVHISSVTEHYYRDWH